MRKVEYLGFEIGEGQIKLGERKIILIEQFSRPKTVHEVRRFVGLARFFRRLVPSFVKIIESITDLHKKL